MRPTSVTVSSVATSAIVPMNWKAVAFKVSIAVVVAAGSNLTYKVQHTFDDVFDSTVTPTWFDHATLTGKTVDADGSYTAPVTGIRLNVTAHTTGSATLTIISQGG